jgi:hypothetical protein
VVNKAVMWLQIFGSRLSLLPNNATYIHQQGPTNICSDITSTKDALPDDYDVTTPKYVRAVLMYILNFNIGF